MSWQAPKTNWNAEEVPLPADFNRIEANLAETAPAKAQSLGDLIVGAGLNAIKRLALGAANRVLRVNAGGTDLEWDRLEDMMPKAGGTFTGVVVGQANTSYSTRQLRNVIMSPNDPSGGSNGDIWIKYEG